MAAFPTLESFVTHLEQGDSVPRTEGEPWPTVIARIRTPGHIAAIGRETYLWFLEVLPPRYLGPSCFAFAEGREPLRLFWHRSDRYFARQLTWDETLTFCTLAHIAPPH